MAYEFLAAGIKPADPFGGFMRGLEQGTQFQQNREINAVNIEAGKKRNELAGFELEKASKQVQAEKAWAQIPVGEDGSRDPAAVAAVEKISPEYVRTQKQAEIQLHRDELGQTLAELETASFMVSKAKTPQELEAALAKVKEMTGIEVSPDEAGVLGFTNAAKSFADEATAWDDAYKNAKTPEEARRIKAHVDARAAEEMANLTLANLKVRSEQTKISANLANADKYRAQAEAARSGTGGQKPPAGFRWKADGSQEPIPGGPVDIKLAKQQKVEQTAAETVNSIIDNEINNIDKLIGSEDGKIPMHPGLNAAVGSVDARTPTFFTDTSDAESLIESLRSKASIGALRDVRSGGAQSIGQITEREWPRLESYKVALSSAQSDGKRGQFVQGLREYRAELVRTKRDATDALSKFLEDQHDIRNPGNGNVSSMSDTDLKKGLGL